MSDNEQSEEALFLESLELDQNFRVQAGLRVPAMTYALWRDAYPRETQSWLSIESILQLGLLPLGLGFEMQKRRGGRWFGKKETPTDSLVWSLNIGYLFDKNQAERLSCFHELHELSGKRFQKVKLYPINLPQYLHILQTVYGLSKNDLIELGEGLVHPNTLEFLSYLDLSHSGN